MSEIKLFDNLLCLLEGILACLGQELDVPALTLIYSTIDTAGWLDSNQPFATRDGFLDWTNKYLLTAKPIACDAIDLYAARCGILHTFTPDSQLSNDGKARRLCYAWGKAKVQDLQRAIDLIKGNKNYAAVHVNDLYEALKLGLIAFVTDIENDPIKNSAVTAKAKKFFSKMEKDSIAKINAAIDGRIRLTIADLDNLPD